MAAEAVAKAAEEICAGRVEARLGGFLVKKRVAKRGGGKSDGFRLIVAVKEGERLIFLHVFEKADKANISNAEQTVLADVAATYMSLNNDQINALIEQRRLGRVVN